jgi:replication fork clamp-binding protein CrfC
MSHFGFIEEYFKNVKPAIEEQYKKLKNSQHTIFQQRTAFYNV